MNPGQTVLVYRRIASDANPNQSLTFQPRLTDHPGATIGVTNGSFLVAGPPAASANTSNNLQIVVSDGSTPPLTASRTFAIIVNPLTPVILSSASIVAGDFQLQVSGTIGPDYILQANSSVTNSNGWVNVVTNTPSVSPFTLADTNITTSSNRFYRIRLSP